MNKQRRTILSKKIAELETLTSELESIKEGIEGVHDEEEDAFDSMPESLQDAPVLYISWTETSKASSAMILKNLIETGREH